MDQCLSRTNFNFERDGYIEKRDQRHESTICNRNVDVRYLTNILSFKDRSCNTHLCPAIRRRYEHHRQRHHSDPNSLGKRQLSAGTNTVDPVTSVGETTHPASKLTTGLSTKISTEFQGYLHSSQISPSTSNYNLSYQPSGPKTMEGLKKEDLKNVILKWLEEFPFYPDDDKSTKVIRNNRVNDLTDTIYNLAYDVNVKNYDKEVKTELRNFLLDPDFECDKKEDFIAKVSERISKLYSKVLDSHDHRRDCSTGRNGTEIKPTDKYVKEISTDDINESIERAISDWLVKINLISVDELGNNIDENQIKSSCKTQLKSLVKRNDNMTFQNAKIFYKAAILDILYELPVAIGCERNRDLILYRYADELANKLLAILVMMHEPYCNSSKVQKAAGYQQPKTSLFAVDYNIEMKRKLSKIIKPLRTRLGNQTDIEEGIVEILFETLNSSQPYKDLSVKEEIFYLIKSRSNIPKHEALSLTNLIVENVKHLNSNDVHDKTSSMTFIGKNNYSKTFVVLTSDHNLSGSGPSNYPVTSTPKKFSRKQIPRLNQEERSYMDKVAQLVRAWAEDLPEEFNALENKNFKETMIFDLAGDLMDEAKLEQLAPQINMPKEKAIKYIVYRWLLKCDIYDDLKDPEKLVSEFMRHLNSVPIPTMTRPQHGGRQAMENIKKFYKSELKDYIKTGWKDYVPKGIDILEDEISVWMNEQPSTFCINEDKDERNKQIHEVALKLEERLKNNRPSEEIKNELANWLKTVVNPIISTNINQLSEQLKEKVMRLPMDDTIVANYDRKLGMRKELATDDFVPPDTSKIDDIDKTLKELVDKFIQHNYDEDDLLVKDAYCEILKTEFRILSPSTRKEVCGHCAKSKMYDDDRLNKELQYIRDISDWLKNIQIDNTFNIPGNKERVEFINNLARDISEVEIHRIEYPNAIDYNMYLQSIIERYVPLLPILANYEKYIGLMVNQLTQKIISSRPPIQGHENQNVLNDSFGIQEQTLNEFIDQYIRINSKDIADDPVKVEAWIARVLNEIKKIVSDTSQPTELYKMKIYDKLSEMTSDDQVKKFDTELTYAKEIGEWMKNMPLKLILDSADRESMVKMISKLAKRISDNDNKLDDMNTTELETYIKNWITELPLESNANIDIPILIQQLLKRANRVINKPLNETIINPKGTIKDSVNRSICDSKFCKHCPDTSATIGSKIGCSGELVVETIDNWCKQLPLHGEEKHIKNTQDQIARRLYQKVIELNVDPSINNDDTLYEDMLSDEIDLILEDILQNDEIKNRKDTLKTSLLDNVTLGRAIIKEKTAGENYKQKLDHTIQASIPAPVTNREVYDPGFELYRNHVVNIFLLQNFDYRNDEVKLKYESRINYEIDKHFQEALKRNALPISKEDMFNEIYSSLYKVPIPNERSVAQEVEKVKTRYDIDGWFETLPTREPTSLNEELEWDQILSMLAKRIYEIEHNESNPTEKIHKEVVKWLPKLPLKPDQQVNIHRFAKDLGDKLHSTKDDRKCVIEKDTDKISRKGKRKKAPKLSHKSLNNSQIPGPSSEGKIWSSPEAACCQDKRIAIKKSGDIILEIVEKWCNQLPLIAKTSQEVDKMQTVKDDLVTKVLMKISEIHANPKTLDDDLLFDDHLDDELERIFDALPSCCELQRTKVARKEQLKQAIRSIKPLIKEERAGYEYKKELKNTVTSMLDEPQETTAEKIAVLKDLIDEITNSFVQYHYNRDDFEVKQVYKNNIYDAIMRYFGEINKKEQIRPLIKQNQLLCELAKIPKPSENAIRDEIEEMKMKDEVCEFLNEVVPDEKGEKSMQKKQIESNLAKRLNDLEKNGHNCTNEKTMKEEIARSLKKLNTKVNMDSIGAFVAKLKNNEIERKAPPIRKPNLETSVNVSDALKHRGWVIGHEQSFGKTHPDAHIYSPSPYLAETTSGMEYHSLCFDPQNRPPPEMFQNNTPVLERMLHSSQFISLPDEYASEDVTMANISSSSIPIHVPQQQTVPTSSTPQPVSQIPMNAYIKDGLSISQIPFTTLDGSAPSDRLLTAPSIVGPDIRDKSLREGFPHMQNDYQTINGGFRVSLPNRNTTGHVISDNRLIPSIPRYDKRQQMVPVSSNQPFLFNPPMNPYAKNARRMSEPPFISHSIPAQYDRISLPATKFDSMPDRMRNTTLREASPQIQDYQGFKRGLGVRSSSIPGDYRKPLNHEMPANKSDTGTVQKPDLTTNVNVSEALKHHGCMTGYEQSFKGTNPEAHPNLPNSPEWFTPALCSPGHPPPPEVFQYQSYSPVSERLGTSRSSQFISLPDENTSGYFSSGNKPASRTPGYGNLSQVVTTRSNQPSLSTQMPINMYVRDEQRISQPSLMRHGDPARNLRTSLPVTELDSRSEMMKDNSLREASPQTCEPNCNMNHPQNYQAFNDEVRTPSGRPSQTGPRINPASTSDNIILQVPDQMHSQLTYTQPICNMNPQDYQRFNNGVEVRSSSVRPIHADCGTPLKQSTRVVSNISVGSKEQAPSSVQPQVITDADGFSDVGNRGTNQIDQIECDQIPEALMLTPRKLQNSPRKRTRARSPEDICDCLSAGRGGRRCMPISECCDRFRPYQCDMPRFPRFFYF